MTACFTWAQPGKTFLHVNKPPPSLQKERGVAGQDCGVFLSNRRENPFCFFILNLKILVQHPAVKEVNQEAKKSNNEEEEREIKEERNVRDERGV